MSTMDLLNGSRFNVVSGGQLYCQQTLAGLASAGVPTATILGVVQAFLAQHIDASAELIRDSYLTPGMGQILEYQETMAEANAALAAPSTASATLYPMLAATIGVDVDPTTQAPATDVLGVARAAVATYQAFVQVGAAIRKARVAGKAAVAAATTIAAAAAAVDAITFPPASSTPAP